MVKVKTELKAVTIDAGVLPRIKQDDPVVAEYAEILRLDPKALPPPVAFNDGHKLWLADGVKRLAALAKIGVDRPICDIRKGARSEAVFFASGANREHGVRLTNAEKKQAVVNCLTDAETAKNSDPAIAEQCGVGRARVAQIRQQLVSENKLAEKTESVGKDGKVRKTGDIGGKKAGGRPSKVRAEAKAEGILLDSEDNPVPEWCRPVFVLQREVTAYWNRLSASVISPVERFAADPSGGGVEIDPKIVAGAVNQIRTHLRDGMPHAVCPECVEAGDRQEGCETCGGKGWLTKPEAEAPGIAAQCALAAGEIGDPTDDAD